MPSKKTLLNCYNNNPDGCGFMYNDNDKVVIKKGFFNFEDFYKTLNKVDDLKSKDVVMHFRIATSGGINKEKCHPFVLSDRDDLLNSTSLLSKYGVCHNGVLSKYVYKGSSLSDTQNFIKDALYPLYKLNNRVFYDARVRHLLDDYIGTSKLAIMNKSDLFLIGDYTTDNDGIKYSNTSYQYDRSLFNYSYTNYFSSSKPAFSIKEDYEELVTGDKVYTQDNELIVIDKDKTYYIKNKNLFKKTAPNVYSLQESNVKVSYNY